MMFQKMFGEAGAPCCCGAMAASNMSRTEVEDSFDRLRRQAAARKNRLTAGSGMFTRRAYRHM